VHGFSGPFGLKWFLEQNRGRDGAISTPNELVLPFGGFISVPIVVKINQEMRL